MHVDLKRIRTFRRSCQVSVVLLFILVPLLNMNGITIIRGDFYDFSFFGIPLVDPFFAFQTIIEAFSNSLWTKASFFDLVHWHFYFGLVLALVIAFFLGPIFCSWICPYGYFSELVWKYLGGMKAWQTRRGDDKHRMYYSIKFIIFIACSIYVFVSRDGAIGNYLSMPGWYAQIFSSLFVFTKILFIPIAFMLGMLVLEILFKKRFWCLYFCPQSVLLATMAYISPFRMHTKFSEGNCSCPEDSKSCLKNCSLGLNSRKLKGAEKMQCANCFECAMTCANGCKSHTKSIRPTFTF